MRQKLLSICIISFAMFTIGFGFAEVSYTKIQLDKLNFQARQNKIDAIRKLNYYYFNKKDYIKALRYIEMGVKLGDPASIADKGLYQLDGLGGVKKNYQAAIKNLKEGAKYNYPAALNSIGLIYQNGLGVSKDLSLAKDYFYRAIKSGSKSAKYNLAMLIQTQNPNLAFKMFLELARQKDPASMLAVGFLYQDGYGVSKSLPQAYKWFVVLKNLDYKPSQIALINLIKEMTPEQIAQGKKLVAEYNQHQVSQ